MLKSLIAATLLLSCQAYAQHIKIFVSLNPAGDFVAETDNITGNAVENPDGSISAKDIKVDVKSLKSGITLRDEHMTNKYLEASKYPHFVLREAKGKDGKGKAILVVKNKAGKVEGDYMKGKDKIKAIFKLKISDFGIEDINYKGIGVENEVKVEVIVPLVKGTGTKAPAKSAAKAPAKPAAATPAAPKPAVQPPAKK